MSYQWIHQSLRRHVKFKQRLRRRKYRNRRLLLETLGSRQLLAGDMPNMEIDSDSPTTSSVIAGHDRVSSMMGSMHETQHNADPASMSLVSTDQATHTVVASGNWSNPEVWENGVLPDVGARIMIPAGVTLTVDSVLSDEFKTIGIHGTLRFANDVDTELRVDTIVSAPHGRFEMGTSAAPVVQGVTAKVVFADDGIIDTSWDPDQLSRGAILHGSTEIHGAEKTHRVTLAEFPAAGATSIELSSVPVNWNVGDEIVITGTQGSTSDEVRVIESIDGAFVSFGRSLEADHIPPSSDLNVYVANKSRNVQFSSENPDVAHRGHIMLMHTLDVDIRNAEFSDLGRTDKSRPLDDLIFEFDDDAVGNQTSAPIVFTTTEGERTNVRGRYAVHFHRGSVDPTGTPAVISGSVVDGSPGWGFVNHSANVNMINNVAYGVQGAAFYTEVGDEIGSMVGNIAIRTVNPTFVLDDEGAIDPDLRADRMDFGVDGDGFWLSGHMVSMRDNVSAGASAHGIIIWSDGVIEPDLQRGRSSVLVSNLENGHLITGRDSIPTWWAPLSEISNNESYGATIGFRSRYVHSAGYLGELGSDFHTPPDQAYIDTLNPTIDGLTVWGSRDGMLMNYNERMSIRNARLIGVGAPYVPNGGTADTGVGIDMHNEVTRGPGVIENVSIEGFNMGLLAPRQDAWQLNNVQLSNTTDMLITEARQAPRELQMTNVAFRSLDGTAVADQADQRRNIVLSADFETDSHQPFFFLMSDSITFDGHQIYFAEQAADFVPMAQQIAHEAIRLPNEMIGQSNQQLRDRFGTSFGGAVIPDDATPLDFLQGGLVGSVAEPAATSPPLYHMASEGADGLLVDPGTLTNFSGPVDASRDDEDGDEDGDDGVEDEEQDDRDEDRCDDEHDDEESDSESDNDDPDDESCDDRHDAEDEMDSEPDDDMDSEPDDEDVLDDREGDGEDPIENVDDADDDSDLNPDVEVDDPELSDDHRCAGDDGEDSDDLDFDEDMMEVEDRSDDEDDQELDFGDDEPEDDTDSEQDFHNEGLPTDVNNDGFTSSLDALLIVNFLSRNGPELLQTITSALEHYIDVNKDGAATALDVLRVLNTLSNEAVNNQRNDVIDYYMQSEDEDEDEWLTALAEGPR